MTPSDKPKPIVKRERPLVLAARYGRFYLSLVIKRFVGDGCQHSAAALTYMTLFAVVPMMTVMFTMLSLIPSFGEFDQQLEAIIVSNLVPSSGNELMQYLEDFTAQALTSQCAGNPDVDHYLISDADKCRAGV